MTAPRDKSYDASLTTALTDPAEAAAYIEAVLELDDPAALLVALRQVAKSHGMAEVARRADVGDKTLFRALSESGNPTLDTVNKVLHAVGLRLSVAPLAGVHG
ncbi:addiction module antidote protein [Roseateles saccharophilus]|uniref:Putative addiction module antidote protein n=1 Tax=Roseateles saccharophilus TaxID=304 RepID=A0A4R3V1T8_ROSSA|nr:addiction module antidote protein [Roseateles saccharophilus]MDG0831392.1 putative addiction module antidote protein [Roseateles saccharophilus]TCU98725.1 putative addiction module antidote protein [Roseateles saccharophilus]